MKKTNVAELLKDCPSGMELDCAMYDNVYFDKVTSDMIKCFIKNDVRNTIYFQHDGAYLPCLEAKCVIFPKGKTTWEGFVPPCKFKEGDVLVSTAGNIVLCSHIDDSQVVHFHCRLSPLGKFKIKNDIGVGKSFHCTLASDTEKQKLFDKLKSAGYKYNPQANKLEKLTEPKFKVGDRIKSKINQVVYTITNVREDAYLVNENTGKFSYHIPISGEKNYELISDKFDIATLKPFESRVLVRDTDSEKWSPTFWGFYDNAMNYPYECCGNSFAQCIPYEGNEHLRGTTHDCEEYYKTWE